jgi:hypothetical protein
MTLGGGIFSEGWRRESPLNAHSIAARPGSALDDRRRSFRARQPQRLKELTKRGVPARLVAQLEIVDIETMAPATRCPCEALADEQREVVAKKVCFHPQRGSAAVIEHEEASVRVVENDGQADRCDCPVANERVRRGPGLTAQGAVLEFPLVVHSGS